LWHSFAVMRRRVLLAQEIAVRDDPYMSPLAGEVTRLYLGMIDTLRDGNPAAVQAALAMAIVTTGEDFGHADASLLDWIDATAASARTAVLPLEPEE
jgi:hypothetical protein